MDYITIENVLGVAVFFLRSFALFFGIPLGLMFFNWLISWALERWGTL